MIETSHHIISGFFLEKQLLTGVRFHLKNQCVLQTKKFKVSRSKQQLRYALHHFGCGKGEAIYLALGEPWIKTHIIQLERPLSKRQLIQYIRLQFPMSNHHLHYLYATKYHGRQYSDVVVFILKERLLHHLQSIARKESLMIKSVVPQVVPLLKMLINKNELQIVIRKEMNDYHIYIIAQNQLMEQARLVGMTGVIQKIEKYRTRLTAGSTIWVDTYTLPKPILQLRLSATVLPLMHCLTDHELPEFNTCLAFGLLLNL